MAELMLVGFISIALTVGEDPVSKICVPSKWVKSMHQCKPSAMHEKIQSMDHGICGEVSTRILTYSASSVSSINIVQFP